MRHSNPVLLLIAPLLLIVTACSTVKKSKNDPVASVRMVPFTAVGKGALFGGGQEGFSETESSLHVLRTEDQWREFKSKMNSVNQISGGFKESELDFNTEMLVAIIDKVRGSGGYEITIAEVSETATKIVVAVKYSDPPEMAASVLTQPFHVIRIPTTTKPVEWIIHVPEF